MVAAAVFCKHPEYTNVVDLVRYASSVDIIGGLNKIIEHTTPVLKEQGFDYIVSFVDRSVDDGTYYENLGWTFEDIISPDYFYFSDKERIELQSVNESDNKRKVYDCGLIKYKIDI